MALLPTCAINKENEPVRKAKFKEDDDSIAPLKKKLKVKVQDDDDDFIAPLKRKPKVILGFWSGN